ncbi:MAG: hypothetical protein ABFD07_14235 [Methanobacterium sp.]
MVKFSTPFFGEYALRYKYSRLVKMSADLGLESMDEIGGRALTTKELEKVLYHGLVWKYPNLTMEDLEKEDGIIDQYMDSDGGKDYKDLIRAVLQGLADCGLITLNSETATGTQQVADMGETNTNQLTNG